MRSRSVAIAAMMVCQGLAACTPSPQQLATRSIEDGSAKAALQAHFDRNPQCASVLSGTVPLGLNSRTAADEFPSERALFEAGLLRVRARPELRITDESPLEDQVLEHYARFAEPTPEARRWFRIDREGAIPRLKLCYGRREVTRVWVDDLDKDDLYGPSLHYAFRVVDPAPWTSRPAIRRAFPFLDRVIGQERGGDDVIPLQDGAWRLSFVDPHITLPDGELEAFLHCPTRQGDPPLPGCER